MLILLNYSAAAELWETKRRNPTGLAAKVLATIQDHPAFFSELSSH